MSGASNYVQAAVVALAVVLAGVVAMKLYKRKEGFVGPGYRAGTQSWPHVSYHDKRYQPYTVLNKKLDAIRGYRNDGFGQDPIYATPQGLDRYHRSGAWIKPELIAEAERQDWYSATDADSVGAFNPESGREGFTDVMQPHTPEPKMDYDGYVTDLIADPRMRDNQRRWVEEMKPWSGTPRAVDKLEMDVYVPFVGLQRPQAVVQYNPMMLTEIDSGDLAVNKPFRFTG